MSTNDQVTTEETKIILELATKTLTIEGDYVELGCYRGDTSILLGKLLAQHFPATTRSSPSDSSNPSDPELGNYQLSSSSCGKPVENQWKTAKKLWIYDSFAGLPTKTSEDSSGAGQNFQAGELLVTKREVITKIKKAGLHNIIVKKAWFNELTDEDLPSKIAFAFLDGDLYGSIKTSLHLVSPRLSPQGVMLVHDYNNPELPGSSHAVDEFLRQNPAFRIQVRATLAILSRP